MPETRWGISAPDFAVGACAGLHTGCIWPSRAAPAQARPGTSESVWVSLCFLSFWGG